MLDWNQVMNHTPGTANQDLQQEVKEGINLRGCLYSVDNGQTGNNGINGFKSWCKQQ